VGHPPWPLLRPSRPLARPVAPAAVPVAAAPAEDDWTVLATYIGLIAALAPMSMIAVRGVAR
jgi:hypothetical protein